MIPKSLSATSLHVASMCMDRWNAEYMQRARGMGNSAADTGSAVHGGFEKYVEAVYINKTHKPNFELLNTFYQMSYVQVFGTTDMDTAEFKDGYELIKKWYARTDLSGRQVVSVERRKQTPIPYNHPDGAVHSCDICAPHKSKYAPGTCFIPFTYIIDRLDLLDEGMYEVVDYKSQRIPFSPEEFEGKIQVRAYALMVQIEHPDAQRVKVTLDFLRHEPVSVWFTREDNIQFWKWLTTETQRIVDTKPIEIKPTLNPECMYCVKKVTCKLIQSNIAVGGIHSLDPDEKVDLKFQLENQKKAIGYILQELDDSLLRLAAESETLDWDTTDGKYTASVTVGRRRAFDSNAAAQIMGPELFAQMGSMTLGNLEKIIKDTSVPKEVRDQLSQLIYKTNGNPGLKIKPKQKGF